MTRLAKGLRLAGAASCVVLALVAFLLGTVLGVLSDASYELESRVAKVGRRLIAPLLLVLLLVSCGPSLGPVDPLAERTVTGDMIFLTEYDIPRRWRHLVAGEVVGPYYFATSYALACRIDAATFTMLRSGQTLRCAWRGARGI